MRGFINFHNSNENFLKTLEFESKKSLLLQYG